MCICHKTYNVQGIKTNLVEERLVPLYDDGIRKNITLQISHPHPNGGLRFQVIEKMQN